MQWTRNDPDSGGLDLSSVLTQIGRLHRFCPKSGLQGLNNIADARQNRSSYNRLARHGQFV